MNAGLEDLVRTTLAERAPAVVRPADWAGLRARATRRTFAGRATVAVGAAAVGTVALTAPWSATPTTAAPATSLHMHASATTTPTSPMEEAARHATELAQAHAQAALETAQARMSERLMRPEWSKGRATDETVANAIVALMTSDHVTNPTAQPEVIWSSAGGVEDLGQGPQVLVAVPQDKGWVVGFWDELLNGTSLWDCRWTPPMAFDTMSSGPLDDRLVGVSLPCGAGQTTDAVQTFFVAPNMTNHVTRIASPAEAEMLGIPVGTEIDLGGPVGQYGFSDVSPLRAYAADGTLLDEETFGG